MGAAYVPPPNGFRTFVIVWITQAFSVFGSAMTMFALNIWLVTDLYPLPEQKPQLALAISATALAFAVPNLVLTPIAGAWADRHDRKRTMIFMDVASGLVSLILMASVGAGILQLGGLLVLLVLAACAGSFHGAAFDTAYAMLVDEKQLPRANGMMQTIWSLSSILSPAAAAALISLPALARQGQIGGDLGRLAAGVRSGGALAMGVDALTFFMAAAALIFLFIPSPQRSDLSAGGRIKKSIWADVREGARFIWIRKPMLWLLGTFTFANLVLAPIGVFMPLIVKFNLNADLTRLGFTFETGMAALATATSLGGLAGGILISVWGGLKHRRVYGVLVSMLFSGLIIALFGLASTFYFALATAFAAMVTFPIANAHSQAIWQSITPRELQGRVFAVRRVIAQFSGPFSTALAGFLAGAFNPGYVLTAMNIGLVVFVSIQLFNPVFMRIEDKEYMESLVLKANRQSLPTLEESK